MDISTDSGTYGPEHAQGINSTPLEDKLLSMILNNASHDTPGPGLDKSMSMPPSGTSPAVSGKPKKRPNQAQRREMSAQLSITFDPRPTIDFDPGRQQPSPLVQQQQQQQQQQARQTGRRPNYRSANRRSHNNNHDQAPPNIQILSRSQSNTTHSHAGFGHKQAEPTPPSSALWSPRKYGGELQNSSCNEAGSRVSQCRPSLEYSDLNRALAQPWNFEHQDAFLDSLAMQVVSDAEIRHSDIVEKEAFRQRVERICQETVTAFVSNTPSYTKDVSSEQVQLKCFGSLSSGFATRSSDMDLGLLLPHPLMQVDPCSSPIPRLLEKALLDAGLGARLLSRTRVPIIKLCERPSASLRHMLQAQRAKCEDTQFSRQVDGTLGDDTPGELEQSTTTIHVDPPAGTSPDDDKNSMESLKQQPNQSLADYFRHARKLLRRLHCHGISDPRSEYIPDQELDTLATVYSSLIGGLANDELRRRLESYPSLAQACSANMGTTRRSLVSLQHQVEGELLVMAWEKRVVPEYDRRAEAECRRIVDSWKSLQRQPCPTDSVYNRESNLSNLLMALRKIPSIRLQTLEQLPHESAASYHSRTVELILGLGGFSLIARKPAHKDAVISHYISGINNQDIRHQLSSLSLALPDGTRQLYPIVVRHKALQLALDFKKLLEQGEYNPEQADVVRNYIDLLRNSVANSDGNVLPLLAPSPQNLRILDAIRALPDPSMVAWNRIHDPYHDKLAFPSSGVGVQCDINFSAQLAIHNTTLLRCYSHTDPRVRPLVLFVKHWAKRRNINDAYRGTLNSYGYVLMLLHYLVNIASPFVCPNLQELGNYGPPQPEENVTCNGWDVRFWRDEEDIKRLAAANALNHNRQSVGALLRGFFQYYAACFSTGDGMVYGFDWNRDVISLRTHGGLLKKFDKGWTGAKTTIHKVTSPEPMSSPSNEYHPAHGQVGTPHMTAELSQPGQTFMTATTTSPAFNASSTEHLDGGTSTSPPPAAGANRQLPDRHQHQQPFAPLLPRTTSSEVATGVRHRFLFAIEDPFETSHNVARTVTKKGIASIRDEFRRAALIIQTAGNCEEMSNLLGNVSNEQTNFDRAKFDALLMEIHGC